MNRYTTLTVIYAVTTMMGCAQTIKEGISLEPVNKQEILTVDYVDEIIIPKLPVEELKTVPVNTFTSKDDSLSLEIPNEMIKLERLLFAKEGFTDSVAIDSLETLIDDKYNKIFTMKEVLKGTCNPMLAYGNKIGFDLEPYIYHDDFRLHPELHKTFRDPKKRNNGLNKVEQAAFVKWFQDKINLDEKLEKIGSFMREHYNIMNPLEKESGVPMEHNAASVLLETDGGTFLGEYKAFNVYMSLGLFGYKENFGKKHLKDYLKWCERDGWNVNTIPSSRAGAISIGQFMPGNLLKYAEGRNPFNMEDALYIVNKFNKNNWNRFRRLSVTRRHYRVSLSYNPSGAYADTMMKLIKRGAKEKIIIRNELGF